MRTDQSARTKRFGTAEISPEYIGQHTLKYPFNGLLEHELAADGDKRRRENES
jgi:hypothetical protein